MQVVLVARVGAASGSRSAAAALACAGSSRDRPGLLIDLSENSRPRPSLIATAAAQALEERLAGHLTDARVAARGQLCQLALADGREGIEQAGAALAIAPGSLGVVHLAPPQFRAFLEGCAIGPSGVLLRADLDRDRALAALTATDLIEAGLRVGVLKSPLGWVPSRFALAGLPLLAPSYGLPPRLCARLIGADRVGV
ncbi:MAG TPA: hypothetical protein VFT84_10525 [Gemmatimonadales bacterium]|nr:hypothetical protein [Gemmatimonadales bacterium]